MSKPGIDLESQPEPILNSSTTSSHFIVNYQRRLNSGFSIGASWSDSLTNPIWRKDNMIETATEHAGDVQTMAVAIPLDGLRKFVRIRAGK